MYEHSTNQIPLNDINKAARARCYACKVTLCARHISANTRPHQLRWGDREMGILLRISCTKCTHLYWEIRVNNSSLKPMANARNECIWILWTQSCTCRSRFILLVWRDPQRYRIVVCGALPSTAVRAKEKEQFGPHGVGLVCWGVRVEQAVTGAPVGNAMEDVAAMSNNPHENAAAARLAILKQPVWFCCVVSLYLVLNLLSRWKKTIRNYRANFDYRWLMQKSAPPSSALSLRP